MLSDLHTCACDVICLSTSTSTLLAQMVAVTGCNLCWWRFSFSHSHKHSLHQWWYHPLQPTCTGGLFPSTHWRTYSTCTQATCTVWWWATCTVWCWSVVVANLHCMVVVCSGGQLALYGGDLWWWWYLYVEVCIYMKIALQPE